MPDCGLCGGIGIHELDNPAVRWICDDCKGKFHTHVAFICKNCGQCYWLPKTPENVLFVANNMQVPPKEIMDGSKLILFPRCKPCAGGQRAKLAVVPQRM